MTHIASSPPWISRPAARVDLAAAGPVEPSSSLVLAPGPTLSPSPGARADGFGSRKTPELLHAARRLHREGENYARIARAIAVAPDTARRWLDADYDMRRRRYAAAHSACRPEYAVDMPTLAFVPGLVVTGRYRMQPPPRWRWTPPPANDRRHP